MATQTFSDQKPEPVSISPLLKRLAYPATAEIPVSAEEIASAFALIFEDRLSVIQTAALLTLLHSTGKDKQADVIAKCSHRMREAASQTDKDALKRALESRGKKEGNYKGGMVSRRFTPGSFFLLSGKFKLTYLASSVTLSEQVEIRILLSISLRRPRLSRRRSS